MNDRDRARFMSRVESNAGDGCWHWRGAIKSTGYGNFYLDGRYVSAHRASYLLLVGPIPDGLYVLHSCDRKRCVNPEHLRIGTAHDNNQDALSRGRHRRGSSRKMNRAAANEIRRQVSSGQSIQRVAESFGVQERHVKRILNNERWPT